MGCETNLELAAAKRLSYERPSMTIERRNHPRTNLRLPVFLLPRDSAFPIRTQTENIGVDGFFCSTEYPFSLGDRVKFLLFLPPAATEPQSTIGMCVHGEAEITRVSIGPHATYGVGCGLSAYRVIPDSEVLSADEAVAEILHSIGS